MGDVIQAALQGKPQPGVVSEKRVPTAGSEAPRSPQRCCAALGCFRAVQTSPLCAPHPSMLCPTEPWVQQTPATSCLQQVWEQLLAGFQGVSMDKTGPNIVIDMDVTFDRPWAADQEG